MKILGFLFAFYSLFLATQPGFVSMEESEEICNSTCCSESHENQETEAPDKEDKACNPFQTCGCCLWITPTSFSASFTSWLIFDKQYSTTIEKVPPHVSIDFWQPPKIG